MKKRGRGIFDKIQSIALGTVKKGIRGAISLVPYGGEVIKYGKEAGKIGD